MADERLYKVTAIFDPSLFASLSDPWTPVAAAGADPSDMRRRSLVMDRVGRFPPEVLGRKTKNGHALIRVWSDGPVAAEYGAYTLGSNLAAESDPPDVLRGLVVPLVTGPLLARVLEAGPTDHLAIDTQGVRTTCYISVLDLDEDQHLQWLLCRHQVHVVGDVQPTVEVRTLQGPVVELAPLKADLTFVDINGPGATDVTLPALAGVSMRQTLYLTNTLADSVDVTIRAAQGETVNAVAPVWTSIPPGLGVLLRRVTATRWFGVQGLVPP